MKNDVKIEQQSKNDNELKQAYTLLENECLRLRKLHTIQSERIKTLESQNKRMLQHNAYKLKEIRALLDTAILNNLEELLYKDHMIQSYKED